MPPFLLTYATNSPVLYVLQGMAFSLAERQALGIHGLLPPRFKTQEEQLQLCKINIDRYTDPLNKYIYLMGLQCRSRIRAVLLCCIPGAHRVVARLLSRRLPNGLWNGGCAGDGHPDVGRFSSRCPLERPGVPPGYSSITLFLLALSQALLDDPLYIGLRQKRVTGAAYDEFIEEFMRAVVRRFGQTTLIQFEDFGNHNAFRLLEKYRDQYCTFNDDIQGTASVAVAGILASLRVTNTRLSDNVLLFQGAGEASLGIASLCVMAMMNEGTSEAAALKRIWLVDSRGLIVKNRPEGGVTGEKVRFAQDHAPVKTLTEAVKTVKPSILIGAAAIGGAFTPEILQTMAANNKKPIVFALSNPTSKAECTAEDAYKHTNGTVVFASGSPFPPVTYNGKTFHPGQGNNAYIFPGVALGVICAGVKHISDEIFFLAAQTLANLVSQKDLDSGSLYPPLEDIQHCSSVIAEAVAEYAYKNGTASTYPKPADIKAYVKSQQYDHSYSSALPALYAWPDA
ncbi:hypothetical protein FOCC_FOCC017293 [Frankliniella occidentalis]|nr:hypothetical protein FOCC_FOCC017293 [Frankliniella occidentalis]